MLPHCLGNFASTKTIGRGYTATAVELRNGRGQVGMIFWIFSGPLRPSPARGRKNFLRPRGRKLRRKARNGAGEGRRGPEKVLRKIYVFCRFAFFLFILAFWAVISFHFGLLGLHFLSFWPFGPSFPFILAFCTFIFFHFGLLGFHFHSFLPFWAFISFRFGLLGLHLAFWAFISFHFGLLGIRFLSFWPFRLSFPFILAFSTKSLKLSLGFRVGKFGASALLNIILVFYFFHPIFTLNQKSDVEFRV